MKKPKPTAVYTTRQDMARVWGDYLAYGDMAYYGCGLACTPNQNTAGQGPLAGEPAATTAERS